MDAHGSGPYLEIQEAVDAASSSDIIVVRSGDYEGFVVDAKGLGVVADRGASIQTRDVVVMGMATGQRVFSSDLKIEALDSHALEVQMCEGSVRVQGCILLAAQGLPPVSESGGQDALWRAASTLF